MIHTIGRTRALLRDDAGASAVEYALLVALIAAAIIVIVESVGLKVFNLYTIDF